MRKYYLFEITLIDSDKHRGINCLSVVSVNINGKADSYKINFCKEFINITKTLLLVIAHSSYGCVGWTSTTNCEQKLGDSRTSLPCSDDFQNIRQHFITNVLLIYVKNVLIKKWWIQFEAPTKPCMEKPQYTSNVFNYMMFSKANILKQKPVSRTKMRWQ